MYYVYVLTSERGKLYVGCTTNLERRLEEHRKGRVYTTKRMGKTRLLYYEAYTDKKMAQERERKLKMYGSAYQGLIKRLKVR